MLRFAFVVAVICCMSWAGFAKDYTIGDLKIIDPWVRATPKGSSVAGGYLTITNTGSTADRLLGGSSDVSERLAIHQTRLEQGIAKMREHGAGLEINPGERVELKPGGYHLMFIGLHKQLMQGGHVKVTLKFEKAGMVDVEFSVAPIGAQRVQGGHEAMPGMTDHQKK